MSSFFDSNHNIGKLLMIIGVISLLVAVASLFTDTSNFNINTDITLYRIMNCVSSVIAGIVFIIFAMDIKEGACRVQIGNFLSDVETKYGLLIAILSVDALLSIVSGICTIIGGDMGTGLGNIVVGALFLVMTYIMSEGDKGIAGNVIWVILCVLFVIAIVVFAFASLVLIGIPYLLLYVMLLIFLLSPEVKEKMGM